MPRCTAFKNKTSELQCTANSLFGHSFCGRHSKATSPRVWKQSESPNTRCAVRIQSFVRGWFLRKYLKVAGPGVLKRKDLANEEELVSCESHDRQYPLDYFSFTENGKTWWFNFATLWVWSSKSLVPTNPYTKVPLVSDTRKRLREMWYLRRKRGLPIPDEPEPFEERVNTRWNILCQAFADNGFVEVTPAHFSRLSKNQYVAVFNMIRFDIPISFRSHDRGASLACSMCNYMLHKTALETNQAVYTVNSLRIIMRLITLHKDPYIMIFTIMSALFRC